MSGDLTTRQFKRDLNMRNSPSAIPLFMADWDSVIMLHLEVSPEELQRETPHPIDTFDGRAFVSLVLFTMRRMRPVWGGRWTANRRPLLLWIQGCADECPPADFRTHD
jgi:uncharacterized protein YqjF (DUF2071 family)